MVGIKGENRRKDAKKPRAFMRIDLTDMLREYREKSWKFPCPCGQGTFVVQDQDVQCLRERDNLLFCYGCRRHVFLDVPREYLPRSFIRQDMANYAPYYGY